MKTNDRITLIYDEVTQVYDPETGEYVAKEPEKKEIVPCLLNFISKAQLMQEYGTINERIMIVRFNREVKPFNYALYENDKYELEDGRDIPIKGALRLKRVHT